MANTLSSAIIRKLAGIGKIFETKGACQYQIWKVGGRKERRMVWYY